MKIGIDFGTSFSVSAAFTLRELNLIREAARDVAGLKVFGFIRKDDATIDRSGLVNLTVVDERTGRTANVEINLKDF